jgi:hypothetical protein
MQQLGSSSNTHPLPTCTKAAITSAAARQAERCSSCASGCHGDTKACCTQERARLASQQWGLVSSAGVGGTGPVTEATDGAPFRCQTRLATAQSKQPPRPPAVPQDVESIGQKVPSRRRQHPHSNAGATARPAAHAPSAAVEARALKGEVLQPRQRRKRLRKRRRAGRAHRAAQLQRAEAGEARQHGGAQPARPAVKGEPLEAGEGDEPCLSVCDVRASGLVWPLGCLVHICTWGGAAVTACQT